MDIIHADFVEWWVLQTSVMTTEEAMKYFMDEYLILYDDDHDVDVIHWDDLVKFHWKLMH